MKITFVKICLTKPIDVHPSDPITKRLHSIVLKTKKLINIVTFAFLEKIILHYERFNRKVYLFNSIRFIIIYLVSTKLY